MSGRRELIHVDADFGHQRGGQQAPDARNLRRLPELTRPCFPELTHHFELSRF